MTESGQRQHGTIMSEYVYVCHVWPRSGFVKIGRSSRPQMRMYSHGNMVIADAVYRLPDYETSVFVENAFLRTWRGLSDNITSTGRSEWFHIEPEEAIVFLKLFMMEHAIKHEEAREFMGCVFRASQSLKDVG